MGKYHGIGGFRIGKVGNERYYLRKSSNVVAIAKPYKAINSQWIKQEEFKAYILSLLNVGVPQVYVLDALPEALFPYALLFIQDNNSTSLYLDKDGERTELHITGGGGGFEPTQPQLAAMNSGITTEKRESYDLSVIGVEDLKTRMLAAETGLGEVESSLETKADKESTYTKTDVNVMLDVKADKLTTYTKTEVDDAIDTLDTKLDRLDVSVDTKLELKLDRRTSTGLGVYCHNGSVQGELSVRTTVASSPSDTSVLTEKAVKTYADSIKTDVNNKLDKRTTAGIWLYSHSNALQGEFHVLPVVEDVATDFDILTAKAVKTYVDSQTVYNHQLYLRFNDGNCKASIVLVNKKKEPLSITELTTILKNGFHNTASNIIGMLAGIIPAMGYYKLNEIWYEVVGVVYNDDTQHVVAIGRQYPQASGPNAITICDAHGGVYTLNDIVSST